MRTLFVLALGLILISYAHADKNKMSVEIIDRRSVDSEYVYVVPGYGSANCSSTAYGNSGSTNCTAIQSSGISGSYHLSGATLSLLLPDGRIAVVNCNSKLNWTEWSSKARRSCREPLVNKLDAEFVGDSTRLEWSVSIDGKKKQQETYKIIGILEHFPAEGEGRGK